MDFKDSLDAWNNSNKYQEFFKKLQEKKDKLFIIKPTVQQMNKNKTLLSDKELEAQVQLILAYFDTPDIHGDETDFILEAEVNRFTKKELFFDFIRTLINWYFYLANQAEKENYELCSKLQQVIALEIMKFHQLIKMHLEYVEAEDANEISEINQYLIEFFLQGKHQ